MKYLVTGSTLTIQTKLSAVLAIQANANNFVVCSDYQTCGDLTIITTNNIKQYNNSNYLFNKHYHCIKIPSKNIVAVYEFNQFTQDVDDPVILSKAKRYKLYLNPLELKPYKDFSNHRLFKLTVFFGYVICSILTIIAILAKFGIRNYLSIITLLSLLLANTLIISRAFSKNEG